MHKIQILITNILICLSIVGCNFTPESIDISSIDNKGNVGVHRVEYIISKLPPGSSEIIILNSDWVKFKFENCTLLATIGLHNRSATTLSCN